MGRNIASGLGGNSGRVSGSGGSRRVESARTGNESGPVINRLLAISENLVAFLRKLIRHGR